MNVTRNRRRASKLALVLLAGGWFVLAGPAAVRAQAPEPSATPAFAACQLFATRHVQQSYPDRMVSIRLLEEGLSEEKGGDKVGSQSVATVLSGQGIWKEKAAGPSNARFVCLLENAATPVYVHVVPMGRRDPADVCWDGFAASEWGKLTQCLQDALKREEAALAERLNAAAQQADQTFDKLSAKKTLQESTAQWSRYRDAECDRQLAFVAGRNHPDIGEFTCKIRKTAQRIADLNFDE